MHKPSFRVHGPTKYDVSLNERLVRALQDSHLGLYSIECMASDPTRPDTAWAIHLSLTAITDGRRGFLIFANDFFPPNSDRELAEFMRSINNDEEPGDRYHVVIASNGDGSVNTASRLDLSEPEATRPVVEAAYEIAFAGRSPTDHAAFFERFELLNMRVVDEATRRSWVRELDDSIRHPCHV